MRRVFEPDGYWRWVGRALVLTVPLSVLSVFLRRSDVSDLVVAAILALVPIAASFVPQVARRWVKWGPQFCFVCPLTAFLVVLRDEQRGWGTVLGVALVSGITALCLTVVTGAITKRRNEVA